MKWRIASLVAAATLVSCASLGVKSSLTDDEVSKYCVAYKKLKEAAPSLLRQVNDGGGGVAAGVSGFAAFERIIKESGLKDYPQFVTLNARIGAIFTILQGKAARDGFGQMKDNGLRAIDDNIKVFEAKIKDPNLPAEAKTELTKALAELRASRETIVAEWSKNSKWADLVLENAQKLTSLVVTKADVETVKRHEARIMEAYTGMAPQKFEVPTFGATTPD